MTLKPLLGFIRKLDQRFPSRAAEASFKQSLEEQMMPRVAVGAALWGVLLIGIKLPILVVETVRTDFPFRFSSADPRTPCFSIYVGLIFLAMVCAALAFSRVRWGWLQAWNWELVFLIFGGSNLLAFPFANELTASILWGAYEEATQAHLSQEQGAVLHMVSLFTAVTYACLHLSLRSHVAWTMAVCLMAPFLLLLIMAELPKLRWSLAMSAVFMFINFCLCFLAACREERNLRHAWNELRWIERDVTGKFCNLEVFDEVPCTPPCISEDQEDDLSAVVPGWSADSHSTFDATPLWESRCESAETSCSESSNNSSHAFQREMESVTLGEIPLPGLSPTTLGKDSMQRSVSAPFTFNAVSPPRRKPTDSEWIDQESEVYNCFDTASNHSAQTTSRRYSHVSDASSTLTPSFGQGRWSRGSFDSPRTLKPFRWQNYNDPPESGKQFVRCRCGARVFVNENATCSAAGQSPASLRFNRTSLSMLERTGVSKPDFGRKHGSNISPMHSPAPSSRPSFNVVERISGKSERKSSGSSDRTGTEQRSNTHSGRENSKSGRSITGSSTPIEDCFAERFSERLSQNSHRHSLSDHHSFSERFSERASEGLSELSLTVSHTTVSQVTAPGSVTGVAVVTARQRVLLVDAGIQTEAREKVDIATQTHRGASIRPSIKEAAAQTCISWERQGFKCNRCARPPTMPSSDCGSSTTLDSPASRRSRSPNVSISYDGSTGGFPRPRVPSECRSSSSKDSLNEDSDSAPDESMLGDLVETTLQGRAKSLSVTMKRWVLKPSNGCCCPWHAAVDVALDMALFLQSESRCKRQFAALSGWQCRHCTVMCTAGANKCVVCGSKRDSQCATSTH